MGVEDSRCIKNVRYPGLTEEEILEVNPFATPAWLKEDFYLETRPKREKDIPNLFADKDCVTLDRIKRLSPTDGKYVAFRALVHNKATWNNGRLCLCYKVLNKEIPVHQRSLQLWSLLIGFALQRRLSNLDELGQILGETDRELIVKALKILELWCAERGYPPLFVVAMYPLSGAKTGSHFDVNSWYLGIQQVFEFGWLRYPPPTEELFRRLSKD